MANIEIRFKDDFDPTFWTSVDIFEYRNKKYIGIDRLVKDSDGNKKIDSFFMNKSTAIRFAKELRKQINLLPKEEVNNG